MSNDEDAAGDPARREHDPGTLRIGYGPTRGTRTRKARIPWTGARARDLDGECEQDDQPDDE